MMSTGLTIKTKTKTLKLDGAKVLIQNKKQNKRKKN